MSILNELHNILQNEESLEDLLRGDVNVDDDVEMDSDEIGGEEEDEVEGEELTDLMKYHKSLQKMIDFIDGLTDDGENNELAFDVEEALRSAMEKMVKLNDAVYKDEKGGEESSEESEEGEESEEDDKEF